MPSTCDTGEAIAGGAVGDPPGDLLADVAPRWPTGCFRRRRPGAPEDPSKIHGLVPVSGRRGTLAESYQYGSLLLVKLAAQRKADGVRDLRAYRYNEGGEAILYGIPGAMSQSTEDGQHVGGIDAAADRHGEVTVIGKYPVGRHQRQGRSYLGRLVARDRAPRDPAHPGAAG